MTRGHTPIVDYTVEHARADFESGIYPAVVAIRLGGAKTESDVWLLAQAEGWRRPAGEAHPPHEKLEVVE